MNHLEQRFLEIFCKRTGANYQDGMGWHHSDRPLTDAEVLEAWRGPDVISLGFRGLTEYVALDLDRKASIWHPANNEANYRHLLGLLEDYGLSSPLVLRSSYSEGLHVYFPLARKVRTIDLATSLEAYLGKHGIKPCNGQLEVFPDVPAEKDGPGYTEFRRLRLPLQAGSVILDDELQPIASDLEGFMSRWEAAAPGNTPRGFDRGRGGSVWAQWRKDCEAVIECGWTGESQTNDLLGKVAEYVMLFEGVNSSIVEATLRMVEIVEGMPGYRQFCNHLSEIESRCREWAESCARHRLKKKSLLAGVEKLPVNLKQEDARQRIELAIAKLREAGELVGGVNERIKKIRAIAKCGVNTLRKYLNLWHPDHDGGEVDLTPSKGGSEGLTQDAVEVLPVKVSSVLRQPNTKAIVLVSEDEESIKPVDPMKLDGTVTPWNPFGIMSWAWAKANGCA